MRHVRLLATALLAAALSLSGCGQDGSLPARFPGVGERILAGPGFARAGDGFVAAGSADPDPVRAAEIALASRGGLRLRLPVDGAGAATLSLPGGFAFEVREHGLSGAPQAVGGALAYPRPGGTSYWTATEAGYEEWLEVEDATATAVAEWEVSGATLRQAGDAVELLDPSGAVRVRVTAPLAFEAGGAAKRAWLRASGGVIALFTDARGPALVDPAWTTAGSMSIGRTSHSATLLLTGKVLVAGGYANVLGALATCELYDPATGTWSATGSMNAAHYRHAAVLLRTGEVLVISGQGAGGAAELYDPATGTWSTTGSLSRERRQATATLLAAGKVLVSGGSNAGGDLASAELYDRDTQTWSPTGSFNSGGRPGHTAALLQNGKVLVVGGYRVAGTTPSELYDPATGTWSAAAALGLERWYHTATVLTDGRVLVTGGATGSSTSTTYLASAVLYDPASDSWTTTGSMNSGRFLLASALLPSGKVLAIGGRGAASAELYDPGTGSWSSAGSLPTSLESHTVTMLPSGSVLVAGGYGGAYLATSQVYDPTSGGWGLTGSLATAREGFTTTLLPNGKVLVAGGSPGAGVLAGAELFDPATGNWSATGSLITGRYAHTATLLPGGKVLVVGGFGSAYLTSAELYDPATGTWSTTGSLAVGRYYHSATLLASGKVLVATGKNGATFLTSAELYDPSTATWSSVGALATPRRSHSATLLPSGKVLVAGGKFSEAGADVTASAELFDPATGIWSATGSLGAARAYHTATLLPNGKVLIAAGASTVLLASALLYEPATETWSGTGALTTARYMHSATLLPSGKVLVTGGRSPSISLNSSEIYDPATGAWTGTAPLAVARRSPGTVLLPSGRLLAVAGVDALALASAELYDEGRGAQPAWIPTLTSSPAGKVAAGSSIDLTGTLFTGLSEGSGGGYPSSAANYPLARLSQAENPGLAFAPVTQFDATSATASIPSSLAPGLHWLSVVVNGVPSAASPLRVDYPPEAKALSVATAEETAVAITLAARDVDGDALTWTVADLPAHGTLSGTPPNLTYTPALDYFGSDAFTFRANDGLVDSAPALVTLTVTNVNDPPDAAPDAFTVPEDTPTTLDVLANDSDVEGDTLTVTSVTQPSNGTVTFDDTSVQFTPSANWHGSTSFTYTVRDPAGAGGTAVVSVTVAPVNDAPAAQPQSVETEEDAALSIALAGVDVDGDTLTYALGAVSASHGTVTLVGSTATYTPNADYSGPDAFTFQVHDGSASSAVATISITVTPGNDPPVALDDSATTDEDAPVTVDVLANDHDADGDVLTVSSVTQPPFGVVTFTATSVRYAPPADWSGPAAFTYSVSDGNGGTATATVGVNVAAVNDAPVAHSQSRATDEDASLELTLAGADVDGDALTWSVSQPSHGSVTLAGAVATYVPAADYHGPDTFTVVASDGAASSNVASISIDVTPVNDAPTAAAQSLETQEDSGLAVYLSGADADADALTYRVVTTPAHGTLVGSDTSFSYLPAADFHGTDAFTYVANDGTVDSPPVTVAITVTPVNDAPVAEGQSRATDEDASLEVTLSGTDVDGNPLTWAVSQPSHGTVTLAGAVATYAPAANYHGPDTFTVVASDGAVSSNVASVSIAVAPVNDPPHAQPISASINEDGPAFVLLTGTDVDGDPLTFTVVTQPAHGALSGSGANLTFAPAPDYHGADAFTFVANDGALDSAAVTVAFSIAPMNDPPVAQAQSAAVDEDGSVAVPLAATDVDGDALTWAVVTQPAHGTVTLSGTIATYTPAPDYHGADAFSFVANDGTVDSGAATVAVTVGPVNDLPVAQAQSLATDEDLPLSITLTGADLDGDPLTFTLVTPPSHGTLTGSGAGLTYRPAADFHGSDSFTFAVSDGLASSASATVSIAVAPVDDPVPSEPGGGCSCATSSDVAPLGALLLALLPIARRRRMPRQG